MSSLKTRATGLPRIFGAIGFAIGRLERLVVHRERPVAHHGPGEQARRSLRVHDVRADDARLRRRRDVGHVVACPLLAVPLDELAVRIPGLAVQVRRSAVVEDAAVDRPGERPLRVDAGVVRIGVVPPRHVVAVLVVAAGIDPAAARGRAVVARAARSSRPACPSSTRTLVGSVGSVSVLDDVAVDLLGDLLRVRIVRVRRRASAG